MWKELYPWKVADAVREGRKVYGLDLRGDAPDLCPVSGITVQEFFVLLKDEKNVMWFVKEEEDGDTDCADE